MLSFIDSFIVAGIALSLFANSEHEDLGITTYEIHRDGAPLAVGIRLGGGSMEPGSDLYETVTAIARREVSNV